MFSWRRPPGDETAADSYKTYLPRALNRQSGAIGGISDWVAILQAGGLFTPPPAVEPPNDPARIDPAVVSRAFNGLADRPEGPCPDRSAFHSLS